MTVAEQNLQQQLGGMFAAGQNNFKGLRRGKTPQYAQMAED